MVIRSVSSFHNNTNFGSNTTGQILVGIYNRTNQFYQQLRLYFRTQCHSIRGTSVRNYHFLEYLFGHNRFILYKLLFLYQGTI
jgi:hypothetical protein